MKLSHPLSFALAALSAMWILTSCSSADGRSELAGTGKLPDPGDLLFTLLPPGATGVRFTNHLEETNERNVFTYRNFYNGGGAAIGDLTGDGLPEIVFTSNQHGPRLYLNLGQFRFRDVTAAAGLLHDADSWTTGVALADVNGDGRLDVYISRAGPLPPERRGNVLWMNQGTGADGVPTFRDAAERYGVADQGYTTQAAFLDYDRDGDLDLFVINNSPRPVSSFAMSNTRNQRDPYGGSRLYRNDGTRFTDVSAAAGIHGPEIAFGLGVTVADVNRDGWPDVYVANDFFERDYLFVNQRNGAFADVAERAMPVLSAFSMGLDIADLDNDGWPDAYTTDMLPEDEYRLKMTSSFESWELYQAKVDKGFHHQLSRNMLQRNNRDGTFSDIAQLAGVARTDWTWSALIADLDLDGYNDIYVTNGMAKDITAQDYLVFLANDETMKSVTSGGRSGVDFLRLTNAMSSTPIPNYAFRNLGAFRFTNAAAAWGLASPSFSSGAAYGDLDGDGALDLVVNNVNDTAFVYRNNARHAHPERRFLRVRLEGEGANRYGVGARVTVHAGADAFMREQAPARGFQSSVDYELHFGLGTHGRADSIRVLWPDGRTSVVRGVTGNQLITLRQQAGEAPFDSLTASQAVKPSNRQPVKPPFADVTASVGLDFTHRENEFVDFNREPLVPKLLSTEGPHLAVADVNADGLQDAYFGGAKGQPGRLLRQQRDGRFAATNQALFAADAISEDVGAVFFDANGDRHPDLYVVSGGSEYSDGAPALQDRLYLNDGRGNFRKALGHLPAETVSGSRVAAADYDGDGDIDLFVGGRMVPWRYGVDPQSMLLRNDGTGHFADVTTAMAPALARVGMVTDALWRDVDGDGRADLVVVGEWMPISIFRNVGGGKLAPMPVRGLERSAGWWNRIVAADFTGDGRVDFVVGNLGLNSRFHATDAEPATMHVADFDGNGFVEQIVSVYNGGVSYPLPLRDHLIRAIPSLRARYANYAEYARHTVADIFSPQVLGSAVVKQSQTFATSLVRSNADGSYTLVPLPAEAQMAPVYAMLPRDFDGDGLLDLLLAGNFAGFRPDVGPLTASRGLVLRGDGRGGFTPLPPASSGFLVEGQARDIQRINAPMGALFVVTRNNDSPLVFRAQPK